MAKIQEMATVLEQTILAESVYSMWLATNVAKEAAAGQFVSLYCGEGSRLLPRPISICQIDTDRNAIRLVYRLAGKGTKEFSKLQTDEQVRILGPLGNGFPLEGQHPIVIGGGIGVPPMLELAKQLKQDSTIILGYRDDQLFLKEQFESYGQVEIATDDGSVGLHGTVVDVLRQKGMSSMPAVQSLCSLPLSSLRKKRASSAIFLWKNGWLAALVHVWAVSARPRK